MRRLPAIPMLVVLVAMLAPAAAARAAVDLEVPERVYAGVPFTINVSISGVREYEAPSPPEIEGLKRLPGTQSNSMTINGRTTVTLGFRYVAERPGTYEIPPIRVQTSRGADQTRRATITVVPIAATDADADELLVEVEAPRDRYYLGEPVELTLKIWLKAFSNNQIRFDARTMFDRISPGTDYGVFSAVRDRFGFEELPRRRADGRRQYFYVYSVTRRFTPRQAGAIRFDDIRVVVNYPREVRRRRGLLGGWDIVSQETISASVDHPPVEILTPPSDGRPASYTGAVGSFEFDVQAKPASVAVGDPITLTMAISDRSRPAAELDLLQPPRLEGVPVLLEDFRIAGDAPVGLVQGRRKSFTQTIRARNDEVDSIPSIPFSYFDPQLEQYVTLSSDPIEIVVRPTTSLSDADIVDAGEAPREAAATQLTRVAGGILANYSGADLLVSSPAFRPGVAHAVLILAPPVVFMATAVGVRRTRKARGDRSQARRRGAKRRALRTLQAADNGRAEATTTAIANYVADRCNLPEGALTAAEVIERLARSGVADDLVQEIRTLLDECEQRRYAGSAAGDADSIAQQAERCLDRLDRERIR